MAIALVKAGAIQTSASSGTITPAFGQATTAGNLLIACVVAINGSPTTTTATGWTSVTNQNVAGNGIYYKANCGAGETAPTFSFTSAPVTGWAILAEFSGAATSSPLDQFGKAGGASVRTTTAGGSDTNASDLAIASNSWACSKSATYTFSDTWTPASGTATLLGDTSATKNTGAVRFTCYLLNGHGGGAADSIAETCTPSTGTLSSVPDGGCIASFIPPPVPHSLVFFDRRIARNSLLRR